GRNELLDFVAELIYSFAQDWRVMREAYLNFALLGAAGSGKTQMGRQLARIFNRMGILLTDNFDIVSRAELVAGYLGQTAIKTQNLLLNHIEGVLFIDEAYSLAEWNPIAQSFDEYGAEAI